MNKVRERCLLDKHAKFYYASNRLFFELKIIRILLYFLAIVPVVITVVPQINTNETSNLICTLVSFAISLIDEALGSFMNHHKDSAICSLQLYETGVTGTPYSKIEYDRELTNELNELAIRRGIPAMKKQKEYNIINVPSDISDDYSYLYICRINAATNNFLLSRLIYIYILILIAICAILVGAIFLNPKTGQYLILIIGFWPLISPVIKDLNNAKLCTGDCTKLCADIDNFFADGDASVERLARMHYYVQQIEFEMFSSRPVIYRIFKVLFRRGVETLNEGVTERFKSAIVELKRKSLMNKGLIAQPKGKALITQKEYDLEQLKKIEKEKKVIKVTIPVSKTTEVKSAKPTATSKETESKSTTKPSSVAKQPIKKVASKKTSTPTKSTATSKPRTTTAKKATPAKSKTTTSGSKKVASKKTNKNSSKKNK